MPHYAFLKSRTPDPAPDEPPLGRVAAWTWYSANFRYGLQLEGCVAMLLKKMAVSGHVFIIYACSVLKPLAFGAQLDVESGRFSLQLRLIFGGRISCSE